jgi:hypothetical protein
VLVKHPLERLNNAPGVPGPFHCTARVPLNVVPSVPLASTLTAPALPMVGA